MRLALAIALATSPALAQDMRLSEIGTLVGVGLSCGHPVNSDSVRAMLQGYIDPSSSDVALGFDGFISYGKHIVETADQITIGVICDAAFANLKHLGLIDSP